jgi:hypothetical protein
VRHGCAWPGPQAEVWSLAVSGRRRAALRDKVEVEWRRVGGVGPSVPFPWDEGDVVRAYLQAVRGEEPTEDVGESPVP